VRRWFAVVLVAAAALSAAACTSDDTTKTPPTDARESPAPSLTPPPTFGGVQHELPTGDALANDPDLYKNVALEGCEQTADGWQATGAATNDSGDELTYGILVFFTDAQARTVDSAQTTVTVAPGGTESWTAAQQFTGEGIQCVVRAVRDASAG